MTNIFFERYGRLGESPKKVELLQTIRINTLKTTAKEMKARLEKKGVKLESIPSLPDAFRVIESPFSLGASIEYLMGYISLQEEAAQYPVHVLNPKPGETVLDLCAAPGMKTTQIAQLMKNEGTLIALDPTHFRLTVLCNHLERCGITNTAVFHKDGRLADELRMQFDKILVDAPCSGNFMTDETWLSKRDLAGVETNARLQKQLLTAAIHILKPGGELVYSTCSLEPEENELMLDWLLTEYGSHDVDLVADSSVGQSPSSGRSPNDPTSNREKIKLKLLDIDTPGDPGLTQFLDKKLNPDIKKARRFWPWKTKTQGFFVAKLKKC